MTKGIVAETIDTIFPPNENNTVAADHAKCNTLAKEAALKTAKYATIEQELNQKYSKDQGKRDTGDSETQSINKEIYGSRLVKQHLDFDERFDMLTQWVKDFVIIQSKALHDLFYIATLLQSMIVIPGSQYSVYRIYEIM